MSLSREEYEGFNQKLIMNEPRTLSIISKYGTSLDLHSGFPCYGCLVDYAYQHVLICSLKFHDYYNETLLDLFFFSKDSPYNYVLEDMFTNSPFEDRNEWETYIKQVGLVITKEDFVKYPAHILMGLAIFYRISLFGAYSVPMRTFVKVLSDPEITDIERWFGLWVITYSGVTPWYTRLSWEDFKECKGRKPLEYVKNNKWEFEEYEFERFIGEYSFVDLEDWCDDTNVVYASLTHTPETKNYGHIFNGSDAGDIYYHIQDYQTVEHFKELFKEYEGDNVCAE